MNTTLECVAGNLSHTIRKKKHSAKKGFFKAIFRLKNVVLLYYKVFLVQCLCMGG